MHMANAKSFVKRSAFSNQVGVSFFQIKPLCEISVAKLNVSAWLHGMDQTIFIVGVSMSALQDAGFIKTRSTDWAEYMAMHFANLARRIEDNYDELVCDIPEETIAYNLTLWRFGQELALRHAIGWSCFIGYKRYNQQVNWTKRRNDR